LRLREPDKLLGWQATMIFYTPPHGLVSCLSDMVAVFGPARRCCVARELTKVHETFVRGTLDEVSAVFDNEAPRGEITLLVEGSRDEDLAAEKRGNVRVCFSALCAQVHKLQTLFNAVLHKQQRRMM
jgi:16S rRNA C1402 (ribose-2'-O) methylase RsmI